MQILENDVMTVTMELLRQTNVMQGLTETFL